MSFRENFIAMYWCVSVLSNSEVSTAHAQVGDGGWEFLEDSDELAWRFF